MIELGTEDSWRRHRALSLVYRKPLLWLEKNSHMVTAWLALQQLRKKS